MFAQNAQNPVQQPNRPDAEIDLIRAMAAGDANALESLYARFGPGILSYLTAHLGNRQLAEEVLQDVMLAAWQNAASFRGESKVLTWLLVIARNRALNAVRKHSLPSIPLDEGMKIESSDTGPIERMERDAQQVAVRKALGQLPAIYREILTLVFYNQLSGPEIAQVLGINAGTVKSRLHRAKDALRQVLPTGIYPTVNPKGNA